MKKPDSIVIVAALALFAVSCSKQQAVEPALEETTAEDEPAALVEATADPATVTESMEVVEESAAETDPENQKIVLARADDIAAGARTWKYKAGKNFTRMIPTQPTVGGADKIEVAEIFMYSCPHCYDLEAYINKWAENKDPNVRLVRIPASFNPLAKLHAQLYYTEVFLAKTGKLKDPVAFRNTVFEEYHRRNNRLTSETAIQRLFLRAGVSQEDFRRTWSSFEVDQALRNAQVLATRYGVSSVPMIVVNGKYRTDAASAGGYPNLMEVIDELTAREGLR